MHHLASLAACKGGGRYMSNKNRATLHRLSSQVNESKVRACPLGPYHPERPSPVSSAPPPILPYTLMPTPSLALAAPLASTRALPLCRHTLNRLLHADASSARAHCTYSSIRASSPPRRTCSGAPPPRPPRSPPGTMPPCRAPCHHRWRTRGG